MKKKKQKIKKQSKKQKIIKKWPPGDELPKA